MISVVHLRDQIRCGTAHLFLDEDECVTNNNNCHQNATCGNTVGSFTCSCNNGFTGDGTNCVGKLFSFISFPRLM